MASLFGDTDKGTSRDTGKMAGGGGGVVPLLGGAVAASLK